MICDVCRYSTLISRMEQAMDQVRALLLFFFFFTRRCTSALLPRAYRAWGA